MTGYNRSSLFILFLLAYGFSGKLSFGQAVRTGSEKSFVANREMARLDTLLWACNPDMPDLFLSLAKEETGTDKTDLFDLIDTWVKARKRLHRQNSGLNFSTSYNHRFGSSTAAEDEYDEFGSYSNRIQVGLSWDLLRNGLWMSSKANEQAILQGQKKYNVMHKQVLDYAHEDKTQQIMDDLNNACNYLLFCKKELYMILLRQWENLESMEKRLTQTDVIALRQKIAMIDARMKFVNEEKQGLPDLNRYIDRQVVLDTLFMYEHLEQSFDQQAYDIDRKILENEKKTSIYMENVKLSPFLRYNYYDQGWNTGGKSNVDAGITLSLPIGNPSAAKRRELSTRIKINDMEKGQSMMKLRNAYISLVRRINHNLTVLHASMETLGYVGKQLENVKKLFSLQRVTSQQVLAEYENYIDMLTSVYELIKDREEMVGELYTIQIGSGF